MTTMHRKYVTAVPASEHVRKDFPRVAGVLDVSPEEFMGDEYNVFTVHCKYEDGDDCPVEVQEAGIKEANPRRNPETVMPISGGE